MSDYLVPTDAVLAAFEALIRHHAGGNEWQSFKVPLVLSGSAKLDADGHLLVADLDLRQGET